MCQLQVCILATGKMIALCTVRRFLICSCGYSSKIKISVDCVESVMFHPSHTVPVFIGVCLISDLRTLK